MKKHFTAFLSLALAVLSGCAVYQPLISHEITNKNLKKFDAETCVGDLVATLSLKRACMKLMEIESARNSHLYVNAVSTNVLIPLTAFVAYRTAKQQHPNSTGALAAGGVASYLTVGQLAPGERIEAYSRGTKAISCAIGKYRRAMASVTLATIERQEYDSALTKAKALVKVLLERKPVDPAALSARDYIRNVESAVLSHSASSEVDASLDEFIGQAIEDLNGVLRGTLPTLSGLSAQIATLSSLAPKLQSPPPTEPSAAVLFGFTEVERRGRIEVANRLAKLLEDLKGTAEALMTAEINRASADFTACQISMEALVAQGIYKPLMLGPGNSQQGQTVKLEAGSPRIIPLIGGLAPLSHLITGENEEFKPTVEIMMQGVALLTVTIGKQDAGAHKYRVTVIDTAGATRWLDVDVPALPPPPDNNQSSFNKASAKKQ